METNLERWQYYMKDMVSPDVFIKWGFYGMITAALQRRVFVGSELDPLFPNTYIILTGDSGVGKGRVLTQVSSFLRHHRRKSGDIDPFEGRAHIEKQQESNLLIPMGSNSASFQKMIQDLADSIRPFWYKVGDKKLAYLHSSLAVCLTEMSSLFRKHMEELVNFLLDAYDCGYYEYASIGRGTQYVKNCCLNILAGTTPGFIKRVFSDELLTEGFASRAIFICAEEADEKRNCFPSAMTPEQMKQKEEILKHIKSLTELYGQVTYTPEAREFLTSWWKTEKQTRINKSLKLVPYYAKKNIIVQKIAMAIHFSDRTDMVLGLSEVLAAMKELEEVEKSMHIAVTLDKVNPLSRVTRIVAEYVKANPNTSRTDLLFACWEELPDGKQSLDEVLDFLLKKDLRIGSNGKFSYNENQTETSKKEDK